MDVFEIDIEKLKRMQKLHVHFFLFDIRERKLYKTSHIPGALHIEPSNFIEKLQELVKQKEAPIVVYGQNSKESLNYAGLASQHGYQNIVYLDDGFKSWQA